MGASKPEEYGYCFWWGDTVGYTNTGSGWISVKDGTSILFKNSGTAASTDGKDNSALQSLRAGVEIAGHAPVGDQGIGAGELSLFSVAHADGR